PAPRTAAATPAARWFTTPRTIGLYGFAVASFLASAASFAAPMANWTGSMIATSCTAFPALGTIPAARPAIATNVAVTSSDGPGWRRKNQDRARPAGRRSPHHPPPPAAPAPPPAAAARSLGVGRVTWLPVAQL